MNILFLLLGVITLNTPKTTLVLQAEPGKELKVVEYGARLTAEETESLSSAGYDARDLYTAYGLKTYEEPAIAMIQPDGNATLDLAVTAVECVDWEGGKLLTVTSRDRHYPVEVKNFFKTYDAADMIGTWTRITNAYTPTRKDKQTIILTKYASGELQLRYEDVWVTTFYGGWGNECRIVEAPLTYGYRSVKNVDGTRNSQLAHAEVMISLDGKGRENEGRVIGAALCWGGDYELTFYTENKPVHTFIAGICPDNAPYYLDGGCSLVTPELAYTWSDEGMSGVSRNFHRWGRKYRMAHGDCERKILLNSWEGVDLAVNEPVMNEMMDDFAAMGGELFVMDDGWFGNKYHRDTDSYALGDWQPDVRKLPGGIASLVRSATDKGLSFGIWIEPEMVNVGSELYEKHPDWVLKAEHRDQLYGRGGTQLILDMANPEVQDFVFSVVDDIMSQNPDIDYIKWDSNMSVREHGSQYLEHQTHQNIAYWKGFEATLERIRAKYPDVTLQNCASGGGRINWGIMNWFDEFWLSDNTDAFQRVYMQWGASYFYPAIATACHVSDVPSHAIRKFTSLKYRVDVAMSGRFGIELLPSRLSEEERAFVTRAIEQYKEIRPVVQFGDIYRLVSPYEDKGCASLMYVSEDKSDAVFYWYRMVCLYSQKFPRFRMQGLDPDRNYLVTELNQMERRKLPYDGKVFSGRFLMEHGLEPVRTYLDLDDQERTEWCSRVIRLTAQ